jgi:hypothetical protein
MTYLSEESCPLNHCDLVSLRSDYCDELGRSACYCPKCDTGFLFITVPYSASERAKRHVALLKWDRRGDAIELIRNDRDIWNQFPASLRQSWLSSLRSSVNRFLADRASVPEKIHCPCDASTIPVGQKSLQSSPPWFFSWCGGCGHGFLFLFEETYGWECAADFRWDWTSKRCRFQRSYPTGGGHILDWEAFEAKVSTPKW